MADTTVVFRVNKFSKASALRLPTSKGINNYIDLGV
jgi:hypothetical protein